MTRVGDVAGRVAGHVQHRELETEFGISARSPCASGRTPAGMRSRAGPEGARAGLGHERRHAADVIGVVMRREDRGERESFVRERGEDRRGIARIHDGDDFAGPRCRGSSRCSCRETPVSAARRACASVTGRAGGPAGMLPAWSRTRSTSMPGSPARSAACCSSRNARSWRRRSSARSGCTACRSGAWGAADTFLAAARTRRTALVAGTAGAGRGAGRGTGGARAAVRQRRRHAAAAHARVRAGPARSAARGCARAGGRGRTRGARLRAARELVAAQRVHPRRLPAGHRAHHPGQRDSRTG